jgi:ubiquinone/menaquinone biosynthesis C-methylase UbiE
MAMSSNEELIRERYSESNREEERSTSSRANTLEFHYTAKLAGQYVDRATSVLELGCGTGFYGVYLAKKCREYVGIDLSPECIEMFNDKIESLRLSNVRAMVGDATSMGGIESSRFDVVMALGPMYHLPPAERDLVFSECKRVCRDGGIIMLAYINKAGAYVQACLQWPDRYPNVDVNDSVLRKGIDDLMPEIFFYTMPEEMEEEARSHGLSVLKNVGVDFVFNANVINEMDDRQFEAWLEVADYLFESPSCTGLSNHTVMVCQK